MTIQTSITTRLALTGTALLTMAALAVAPATAAASTQTAVDEATLFAPAATSAIAVSDTGNGLSAAEMADITYMVEEEKLAHDVYVTLAELWDTPVFVNISRAETAHMGAVETLIDGYGLVDPVGDNPVGVFTNPELQSLYDDLIATGSVSLIDALEVGALVEEVDIADLLTSIDETDASDVAAVWQRLLSGSQSHLRSFTTQLTNLGVSYEPAVLDAATFDEMLAASSVGGNGYGTEAGQGAGAGGQNGRGHGRNG
jgi:hypothetical protein